MGISFLQTEDWQRFLTAYGTVCRRENQLLFIGSHTPVGTSWSSYRCDCSSFTEIPVDFRQAAYLRFEPQTTADLESLRVLAGRIGRPLKHTLSVQPHQTLVKPLAEGIDTILAGMKSKHRYNARLAERKGIEVHAHSAYDEAIFERFWNLLSSTSDRQEFSTFPKEYYRCQWQQLQGEVRIHVLLATHPEEGDLAGMFLLTYGDTAVYLHGGSSDQHKEFMAPFWMQAKAMQFALTRGCTRYDFWGTDLQQGADSEWETKPGSRSYGTSRFKLGFGGEVVEYPGTWDLILKPFWYSLYKTARELRGRKRAFR
jgi:lipid II:glycine glycyltransferase (peptidoglycan interpeptide bridge formation enzyme)